METRAVTAAALAQKAIHRARRRGLDHYFAFVLLPWHTHPERPEGERGPSFVGIATAGGSSMPLTRGLCESLEYLRLDVAGRPAAIRVPVEEIDAASDDPLFGVLFAITVSQRQTACGVAGIGELEGAPLVFTCPRRPNGWPR